ncbi:TylF/MycF/NovP-related O-methyltransferase [Hoeflea sp. AS16]|uniref:TylF/MycF/NovP-related O-methyltransferase n=1 Tax=Hoeflea sp. AS16 TaxID=3135779 RepID=UPI00317C8DB2
MKRVDRLRIRLDDMIAREMETEAGRADYWRRLDADCRQSPLIELLEESLKLEGDVIECGVYRGSTTRLMGRRMHDLAPSKALFACDSFEGFPSDRILDADLGLFRFRFKIRRKFRHASDVPERLIAYFDAYGVNGHVVKGFFSDTLPKMPVRQYCFMFIDCDIYKSHLDCLDVLYDQLVPGGIVVFDDYAEPKWPGASRAVDEFFSSQPVKPERLDGGQKPLWFVRKPLAGEEGVASPEPLRLYG